MRLFTLRGPVLRMPWAVVLFGWGALMLWNGLRWLAAHLVVAGALLMTGLLWWVISQPGGWLWLVMCTGAICLGLGGVMELRPRWWVRLVTAWHSQRRLREYRQNWEPAMVGAKLASPDTLPTVMSHRFAGLAGEEDTDVLTVHMLPGQLVSDWRAQQQRLAAAFGLQRVRVHSIPGQPGDLQLFGRRYRPAAAVPDRTPAPAPVEEPAEEKTEQPRGAFPRNPGSGT